MTRQVLTLQTLTFGTWKDFATGPAPAAMRHIADNPAGIWRAVDWTGRTVLGPRDVEEYLSARGHLEVPGQVIARDPAGAPILGPSTHSPECPCKAGPG